MLGNRHKLAILVLYKSSILFKPTWLFLVIFISHRMDQINPGKMVGSIPFLLVKSELRVYQHVPLVKSLCFILKPQTLLVES